MIRSLFKLASALSLMLCTVAVLLWTQPGKLFGFQAKGQEWEVVSGAGRLTVSNTPQWEKDESQRDAGLVPHVISLLKLACIEESEFPGVVAMRAAERSAIQRIETSPRTRLRSLGVPYRGAIVVLLLVPLSMRALEVLRVRRLRNRRICPSCGYDLRAMHDRCPECGELTSITKVIA
jgi:hypothetical protein